MHAAPGPPPRDRSVLVLVLSGAAGYLAGRYWFAEWQVAVETAQVVAGVVDYPAGNPFYIYHVKLWTILHHVLALGLRAGLTERVLSDVVSGVIGMATFQALGLVAYAFTRDVVLALTFIPIVLASRATDFGVVYPIFLTGTVHTYGAMGLSVAVLAAALLGCGWTRGGFFLAGLAPAIHPALGACLLLLLAAAFALDVRDARERIRHGWRFLAAGLALTAASLALHLALMPVVPSVPADETARYQAAFTTLWDIHRQPVPLLHPGVVLNYATLAITAGCLAVARFQVSPSAALLWRFLMAAALAGLAGAALSWAPPDRLPAALVMLMPARLLNFAGMTFATVALALAATLLRGWARTAVVMATAVALLLNATSVAWAGRAAPDWAPAPLSVLLAAVFLTAVTAALQAGRGSPTRGPAAVLAPVALRGGLLGLAVVTTWVASGPIASARGPAIPDRHSDLAVATAAAGNGVLLAGGDLYLVQLVTRRPVLINGGALDTMAYALESGPAMARILERVYDIDLFDPPAEARHTSVIPVQHTRAVWMAHPPARWQSIREEFGVTQVLTPFDWELHLPMVAQSRRFLLYEIPEPATGPSR